MKNNTDKKIIDWNSIHDKIKENKTIIEQRWQPDKHKTNQILASRAKLLAKEIAVKDNREHAVEVVVFNLAHEQYAIELKYVHEIYPLKEFTPLPCTPKYVLGVINLRGQIISVIDIKTFFELPDSGLTDLNLALILRYETMIFGILVDQITATKKIDESRLQPSIPTLTGIREQYLKGIHKEQTIFLDAKKILTDSNLIVYDHV